MSARYPAVYALLRERMADEGDIPDSDEIIAAALDVARDAVLATPGANPHYNADDCAEAIESLRATP